MKKYLKRFNHSKNIDQNQKKLFIKFKDLILENLKQFNEIFNNSCNEAILNEHLNLNSSKEITDQELGKKMQGAFYTYVDALQKILEKKFANKSEAKYSFFVRECFDTNNSLLFNKQKIKNWNPELLHSLIAQYGIILKIHEEKSKVVKSGLNPNGFEINKMNLSTTNLVIEVICKDNTSKKIYIPVLDQQSSFLHYKNLREMSKEYIKKQEEESFRNFELKSKIKRKDHTEHVIIGSLFSSLDALVENAFSEDLLKDICIQSVADVSLEIFSILECCPFCEIFSSQKFDKISNKILELITKKCNIAKDPSKSEDYLLKKNFMYCYAPDHNPDRKNPESDYYNLTVKVHSF